MRGNGLPQPLFWLAIEEVQLGLDPSKNSELGCSYELDGVLVGETIDTRVHRESNPMVKTLRLTVDFIFTFWLKKMRK